MKKDLKNSKNSNHRSPFNFAPINTGLCLDGKPNDKLIHFHKERSGHEIGINYVGNVAIDKKYTSNKSTLVSRTRSPKWRELSSSISSKGSIPGIQLACRNFYRPAQRKWTDNPLEVCSSYSDFIEKLSDRDIEKILNLFYESSIHSFSSGFQVIQLHCAHGYFLSSLLSQNTNKRLGTYSLENAAGIPHLISRIKNSIPDCTIDVRLSIFEGIENEAEWELKKNQIPEMIKSGAEIISLSAGFYDFSKHLIYPKKKKGSSLIYFMPRI